MIKSTIGLLIFNVTTFIRLFKHEDTNKSFLIHFKINNLTSINWPINFYYKLLSTTNTNSKVFKERLLYLQFYFCFTYVDITCKKRSSNCWAYMVAEHFSNISYNHTCFTNAYKTKFNCSTFININNKRKSKQ